MIVFLLMAFAFTKVPTAVRAASLSAMNQTLKDTIDGADIKILDGAQVSTASPYVIKFNVSIPDTEHSNIQTALKNAHEKKIEDYVILRTSERALQYRLMLFDESKIPPISASLNNVRYNVLGVAFNTPLKFGIITEDGPATPDYTINLNKSGALVSGVPTWTGSVNVGKENVHTSYVPILCIFASYYTDGAFGTSQYSYVYTRLIYNPNAVRSVSYVSQMALADEEIEYEDYEIRVLEENLESGGTVDNLEESEIITNLETSAPLNFAPLAGATYDEISGGITWSCKFNVANFNTWKQTINHLSLWWIVVEFDNYVDTGNVKEDFPLNYSAAEKVYPEWNYYIEGDEYVSTVTFVPPDSCYSENYIAIPFIKAVGVKASVSAGMSIGFNGVASGTYVLCDDIDNVRSVMSLLGDTGEYSYSFTWLEAIEGKPFALLQSKTLVLPQRLDFNTIEMADFANMLNLQLNDNGDIECLLSKVTYWFVQQNDINNYTVNAMYTTVPLTFTNDKRETRVQILGLIPFANIDGESEYAKLLTSLRNKDGVPYFNSLYEVEINELYGYFYTYSYESEISNPNWNVNQDAYNGYIAYFTELTGVQKNIGYMEIGSYGSVFGGVTGLIIGTIAGGPVGAVVGAIVGGVAGYGLSAAIGSLFGASQDTTYTYYNVEYGFLDCTTMTHGGLYKTQAPPELQSYEKIVIVVYALLAVYILATFLNKFRGLHWIIKLILALALIAGFVYGGIALYDFFLT